MRFFILPSNTFISSLIHPFFRFSRIARIVGSPKRWAVEQGQYTNFFLLRLSPTPFLVKVVNFYLWQVLIVLDFVIPRMQSCLNTRIVPVISRVLLVLRTLLKSHPSAGPFLVPHYKKLFPIMSSFLRNPSQNIGTEVPTYMVSVYFVWVGGEGGQE
jgi:hypothetical protein